MHAILKDIYGFLFEILPLEARITILVIILGLMWWWKGFNFMLFFLAILIWVAIAIIAIVFIYNILQDIKKKRETLG